MTGPILTQPEIDALLKDNGDHRIVMNHDGSIFELPSIEELETSERGQYAWKLLQAIHAHLPESERPKGWLDCSDVQIQRMLAGGDLIASAIAAERLACKQLAASYPARQHGYLIRDDPAALAQQVASEIAQAIGARE